MTFYVIHLDGTRVFCYLSNGKFVKRVTGGNLSSLPPPNNDCSKSVHVDFKKYHWFWCGKELMKWKLSSSLHALLLAGMFCCKTLL